MLAKYIEVENMSSLELEIAHKKAEYKKIRLELRDLKNEANNKKSKYSKRDRYYSIVAVGLIALISLLAGINAIA